MRKIIVSVAPIEAGKSVNADSLAEDIKKCVKSGAAMVHLHCRMPDGTLTSDITYMAQCFDKILDKTDIVIQASTGGVSNLNIRERCKPLLYPRIETASLNAGSTNLGDAIYLNSFEDIEYCASEIYKYNIIPDIEVFDIGMIENIERMREKISFRIPIFYNLVFGHKGGMQATINSLIAFRSMVPQGAKWGVTHFGRKNWDFLAAALAMGAETVRIGFEDSSYLAPECEAKYNYELVERLIYMIHGMGLDHATPAEARKILGVLK